MESTGLGTLIDRMTHGDDAAGTEVYVRMHEPLSRFFMRLCGCAATSDDLVQSTFLKLWQGRTGPATEIASTSYVYRVALNEWRTASRRAFRYTSEVASLAREMAPPRIEGARVETRETCRRMLEAIDALPGEQREVLVLHRFEGMSCREIADVVECPAKTVESRLRLALRKLVDRLGKEDVFGPH